MFCCLTITRANAGIIITGQRNRASNRSSLTRVTSGMPPSPGISPRIGSGPHNTKRGTWCAIPVGVRFWRSTLANTREWIEWKPAKTVSPFERKNGAQQTYDPRRLSGVAVYHEIRREFSQGDRIQFTAPSRELQVANRELGTIERVSHSGNLEIRIDSRREVRFNIREHPHLDHGYAVTSHSSQGQTADRVLIHVDTDKSELLDNSCIVGQPEVMPFQPEPSAHAPWTRTTFRMRCCWFCAESAP